MSEYITKEQAKTVAEYVAYLDCRKKEAEKIIDNMKPAKVLEVPCKIGDTLWTCLRPAGLYFKAKDAPFPCEVMFIGINDSEYYDGGYVNVLYKNFGREAMLQFGFDKFGETIFTTKEDAVKSMRWKEWIKNEN